MKLFERSCVCCGANQYGVAVVLWDALIAEWELNPYEAVYIDRQQGLHCQVCWSNFRSMALAHAIMVSFSFLGNFTTFIQQPHIQSLKILEINEAGSLTKFLAEVPGHTFIQYPEFDMMNLLFADSTFDIITHSDTLEHVPNPIAALSECCRLLKPGGRLAFTVPIVVDRLTRSRQDLPPSYHGYPDDEKRSDFIVYTEYGADIWKQVMQAGFAECRIIALEYPAAIALVAIKDQHKV